MTDEKFPDPRLIKRIATVVGLLFLLPILAVTFVEPTAAGESCGTWMSPRFNEVEVSLLKPTRR